jgi:hypothetical protein
MKFDFLNGDAKKQTTSNQRQIEIQTDETSMLPLGNTKEHDYAP